jgi:hypothetical protein
METPGLRIQEQSDSKPARLPWYYACLRVFAVINLCVWTMVALAFVWALLRIPFIDYRTEPTGETQWGDAVLYLVLGLLASVAAFVILDIASAVRALREKPSL